MKKHLLGALITLTGLFALAAGAHAETGGVVVHINQDFVVGEKALPAGTYWVRHSGSGQVLILRGDEPGASAFLLPTACDASTPERRQVKLTRVGDVYYLSEVATENGVCTLAPPRMVARPAKARRLDGMSSSRNH